MTTYNSEIIINYTEHNYCYNLKCDICLENKNIHNENKILDKIEKLL